MSMNMTAKEYRRFLVTGNLPARLKLPAAKGQTPMGTPGPFPGSDKSSSGAGNRPNSPGKMNKTERRFLDEVLTPAASRGEILNAEFERVKLRLAKATWYMPDFICFVHPTQLDLLVENPQCIVAYEIKGFWRDDARVKIKVAAETFPWIRFFAVQLKKGQWQYEEVVP